MFGKALLMTASIASISAVSADGAIVFQEDFDAPRPLGALAVGAADVGEWDNNTTHAKGNVVATGDAGHPGTGPSGGSTQVLHTHRTGASSTSTRSYGKLTTPAATGDTITFEWDSLLKTGSPSAFTFAFLGDAGSDAHGGLQATVMIQFMNTGAIQARSGVPLAWNTIAGATHTLDVWQHYKMEYTLGESDFSLTVGGGTPITVPYVGSAAATEISHIYIMAGATALQGYTDNIVVTVVPEPASLSLLGLGGLAMFARRRNEPDRAS